jgi:hypothetical protein
MKFSTLAYPFALALGLSASLGAAESRPPYLETSSFSILSNFYVTGVTITTRPLPANLERFIEDPSTLKPGERLSTHVGKPITFSAGTGDQAFFINNIQQKLLSQFAEEVRVGNSKLSQINRLNSLGEEGFLDELDRTEVSLQERLADAERVLARTNDQEFLRVYFARQSVLTLQRDLEVIAYARTLVNLSPDQLIEEEIAVQDAIFFENAKSTYLSSRIDGIWELTAVRAPQRSVSSSGTSNYVIVMTSLDPVAVGRPGYPFDTGLRIELLGTAANTTETISSEALTAARGNQRTHFKFEYEFYGRQESRGNFWRNEVSGYLSYDVRATKGPISVVMPTKLQISGTGFWFQQAVTFDKDGFIVEYITPYAGVSPMKAVMGAVKYQDEALFEDIPLN